MIVKDLNAAAAVIAATGVHPTLNDPKEIGLTGFTFPDSPETTRALALFTTGELLLDAKKLLRVRSTLYKQIRRKK